MRTRVYLAGPYTAPDPAVNVRKAARAAHALLDRGYAVFVPHLSHYLHLQRRRPYEEWLAHDLEWVAVCHCLLRLPGKSPGADREAAHAINLGLPVYLSILDLRAHEPATRRPEGKCK